MKSADIRQAFLKFFEKNDHTIVDSSSLVPGNDPTLLFTNAGMVQFKDVFLGQEARPYQRATSSQRCVRAGGKHNDLENVGYTARHHTFFEMLGNFSFGDYFKEDAIRFAWQFLTEELKIPQERLWVTVHISDDEAAEIWTKKIGVDPKRMSRLDEDNFWQMGDTGPCGPCSEIFYDHGDDVPGGPPGSPDDDLDRYIEIWNLVFMQFERQTDGSLKNLPKPSVDTGMGLERMAAVMQGVHNNYDIDLFQNLLKAAAKATGAKDLSNQSLRVIADHIRSCSFMIADGVIPSNEGRGYVLRRIIRRAVRHGNKLGQSKPFFSTLVSALVSEMGDAYPELKKQQAVIEKVLLTEEGQFAKTLEKGMAVLTTALESLKGTEIPGDIVFKLHDTYGFPTDLTNDIAREKNLTIDLAGFEKHMEGQKKKSSAADQFSVDYTKNHSLSGKTEFTGYTHLSSKSSIHTIIVGENEAEEIKDGEEGVLVLEKTPFYAESGGQAGDTGYITTSSAKFEVRDCLKSGEHHLHIGKVLSGTFKNKVSVDATVDDSVRQATALNHSATHLLHAALRKILGEHVTQKGSLVDSEKLRFDFSHLEAVTQKELSDIEQLVNQQVLANAEVKTELCDMEAAKQKGAMALFGEKYGDEVRVLSMGDGFSVELCGGTHVKRTGDIGLLRIVSESGIAAGVRRIEAVTGFKALSLFDEQKHTLEKIAQLTKSNVDRVVDKVEQLVANHRQLEKDVSVLKGKLASSSSDDLLSQAKTLGDVKVLAVSVEGADGKSLRDMVDQLKNKLGEKAVVILAAVEGNKIALVAGVTKALTGRVKAGDLMKEVAEKVGGKGGGRPDMAQGGGTDPSALKPALEAVPEWVEQQIS
ncbi:MAG: alanine--tRNA ligase [Cellvibrionaceae bacterium]